MATVTDTKIFTGEMAIIRRGGKKIGLAQNLSFSGDLTNLKIKGLGNLYPEDIVSTDWNGSVTIGVIMINRLNSGVQTIEQLGLPVRSQIEQGRASLEDTIILGENVFQIDVFKKVKDVLNPDGSIKPKLEPWAILTRCKLRSESWEIRGSSAVMLNQTADLIDPPIYPITE